MSQKQRMTTEEIKAHVEDMFKQFDEVDTIVLTIQGVPKVKNPYSEADRYAEMATVGGVENVLDGLADLVIRSTQSFGEGDSEMESAFFNDLQARAARKIFGEGECKCARCTLERILAGEAGSTPIQ
jgi:hypothetical protein